jgi:excisionase family DNA binding protein
MDITHDNLPKAVAQLHVKLEHIERLLEQQSHQPSAPDPDKLLTVAETADFLRLSVPTVYGLIHKKQLPMMKRAKRCYFLKEDLLNYIKQGKRKSNDEIKAETHTYLKRKGGKQ